MIDLFHPFVPREAIQEVEDVLRSRWIGQAHRVDQFEKKFVEKFPDCENAVTVSSGTSALDTAYDLIDIRPGDEVITTPLTCTATNLPLIRRGAKLVWADVLRDTLCIDPEDVKRKVTTRTKAVVQVHLGGIPAEVQNVYRNDGDVPIKIPVVSDAAQALGIFEGDYTCCSFQAIKHITTGDGGMFCCKSGDEAQKAKLLRWFGIDREKKIANNWQAYQKRAMTFDIEILGTKRHMNDIAAAMGLVGLRYYDSIIGTRQRQFSIYAEAFSNLDGIELIDGAQNKCWLCTVLVDRRDDFAQKMFEADIDTNLVQVRNDIYKVFGGERADLPVMNEIEDKYISLPIGSHLPDEDIHYICDQIKKGW